MLLVAKRMIVLITKLLLGSMIHLQSGTQFVCPVLKQFRPNYLKLLARKLGKVNSSPWEKSGPSSWPHCPSLLFFQFFSCSSSDSPPVASSTSFWVWQSQLVLVLVSTWWWLPTAQLQESPSIRPSPLSSELC